MLLSLVAADVDMCGSYTIQRLVLRCVTSTHNLPSFYLCGRYFFYQYVYNSIFSWHTPLQILRVNSPS